MDHGTLPFEEPHSRLQERAISRARHSPHDGPVVIGGHQDPHIDAIASGRRQGFRHRGRRDEVRIRDPELLLDTHGNELREPVDPRTTRLTFHSVSYTHLRAHETDSYL